MGYFFAWLTGCGDPWEAAKMGALYGGVAGGIGFLVGAAIPAAVPGWITAMITGVSGDAAAQYFIEGQVTWQTLAISAVTSRVGYSIGSKVSGNYAKPVTTTPKAPRVVAPKGESGNVAFGLWRHQGTGAGGQLDRFAGHVGAKTYGDIYGNGTFPTEALLEKMMYGGDKLYVNLDGLVKSIDELPDIVQKGSKGLLYQPSPGVGNITNWEVWRIHQDPNLLKKTTFYLGGKAVNP